MAAGHKTGGRVKGSLNKIGADVRALAQQYTDEALLALVKIIRTGESEQARVAAIKEILDRGHGKPTQPISGDPDAPPVGFVLMGASELPTAAAWLSQTAPPTGE